MRTVRVIGNTTPGSIACRVTARRRGYRHRLALAPRAARSRLGSNGAAASTRWTVHRAPGSMSPAMTSASNRGHRFGDRLDDDVRIGLFRLSEGLDDDRLRRSRFPAAVPHRLGAPLNNDLGLDKFTARSFNRLGNRYRLNGSTATSAIGGASASQQYRELARGRRRPGRFERRRRDSLDHRFGVHRHPRAKIRHRLRGPRDDRDFGDGPRTGSGIGSGVAPRPAPRSVR